MIFENFRETTVFFLVRNLAFWQHLRNLKLIGGGAGGAGGLTFWCQKTLLRMHSTFPDTAKLYIQFF